MASIFGHAVFSIALGTSFSKKTKSIKFWVLGVLCTIIPDADVIGFKYGIKYGSFWGIEVFHIHFFLLYYLVF